MKTTWWKSGDWNAICAVCGWKFKASELKERWDGMRVCREDYDQRHPLDFPNSIRPEPVLPWTRPEAQDQFVAEVCTVAGRQGVAGVGTAGCAIAGLDLGER